MKLLSVPENIEEKEFSKLKTKFQKLHKIYIKQSISSVTCVVFAKEADVNIWIEKKHALGQNGTGTEMWDSKMKQRFDQATKGKKSIVLQIIDLLRNSNETSEEDILLLENVNSSNLDRLISDPYVREKIGLELSNKVLRAKRNRSEVIKSLLYIIKDITRPEFKVADIYTKVLRKPYIDKLLSQLSLPFTPSAKEWNVDPSPSSNSGNDQSTERTNKKGSEEINKIRNRNTLIPKGLKFSIPNNYKRIYDIFLELQLIPIKRYTNTAAVMFRVFLEMSVGAYLETFRMLKDGHMTFNDGKHNLNGQTLQVMNHMTSKGFINRDLAKGIKNELQAESSPLSIESLNAYVHNSRFFPQYSSLMTSWDNVQPFFTILWTKISDKLSNKTE